MHIMVSVSTSYPVKQRLAVKIGRNQWALATVVGERRKYVDILFDDGDEGDFNKVEDAKMVKFLPKGTKKSKQIYTLEEVKALMAEPTVVSKPIKVTKKEPQVTRRVLDMTGERDPKEVVAPAKEPAQIKGRPITITRKPEKVLDIPKEPVPQTTGTLKTRLKEAGDKPIHPMDLNRGMVVQFALNASLITVLLLEYNEEKKKWASVLLRENSKIIDVSPNHCFTRRAPLTPYEKLWAGKYMRRLEQMES